MGFEYSSVVLMLESEYLSTTIEYLLCNIESFVSTHIQFLCILMVFFKYSWIYILFSTSVPHLFYLNIKVKTKNTLIHYETLNKNKFDNLGLYIKLIFSHRKSILLVIRKTERLKKFTPSEQEIISKEK